MANWQLVTEAFDLLRGQPPEEREARLIAACQGDEEAAHEVRALLKAYSQSDGFLESPVLVSLAGKIMPAIPAPRAGQRFGAFRVVRQIGAGGMGEVYEAQRADGEFEQRVALKLIRAWSGDHMLVDRFKTERQILARLNHPNIARLLDGGTSEDGLPFLVMELIEGEPIDEYAHSRRLPRQDRIALLRPICSAIQYAHEQNVIHRDIKPANILVTAAGIPKLLDFGIAKLTNAEAGANITQTAQRLATPEYASPEQIFGRPVTAESDVFSLALVLRRVLEGCANVPPSLREVIQRATGTDPAQRYPSAAAFAEAVAQAAAGPRRRTMFGWAGGAVAAAGAGLWWNGMGPVLANGQALAVMRVENRTGDPALDWLDRGVADLLATNLAQAGGFEVISTDRSRALLERSKNANQRKAAIDAHAGFFVSGDILKLGGRLRMNLRVEQTGSGRVVFAEKFEGLNTQTIFAMADQASAAILRQLRAASAGASGSGDALTNNVEALKFYEEGLELTGRFQMPLANRALRQAVALDPAFVMAYYRLAFIDPWNIAGQRRDIAQAVELAAHRKLTAKEKSLLESGRLALDGRVPEAIAIQRVVCTQNPRDVDALASLGLMLYLDLRDEEAVAAFEDALRLDPHDRRALAMGAYAFAASGNIPRALELADRYIATLGAGDWNGYDTRGDVLSVAERFDEAIADYRKVDRTVKIGLALMHKGDLPASQKIFEGLVAKKSGPVAMGGWLGFLGDIEAARGNTAAALDWFEQGVRAYAQYAWFGACVLVKAAEMLFERGNFQGVLDLGTRFSWHAWGPGIQGAAWLALGRPTEADAAFAAMKTPVALLVGEFMTGHYEVLYRMVGLFYAGQHQRVVQLGSGLTHSQAIWAMSALPLGRSHLALGRRREAQRYLRLNRRAQLTYGMPGNYEAHNFQAFQIGEHLLDRASR